MGYKISRRKYGSKVLTKAKKRICINILSQVKSNLSNDFKQPTIYYVGRSTACNYSTIEYVSS